MASDPRIHKPRSPRIYTDQQLAFLRSNLPEFERRLQGPIRGDAKKFALEKASDFIAQFGLPDDFVDAEESESRFKEQIYNWFKNTVGRARRKLGGRLRQDKKTPEKAPDDLRWSNNTTVTTPPGGTSYSHVDNDSPHIIASSPRSTISSLQFGGIQTSINTSVSRATVHHRTPQNQPLVLPVTHSALRDAFTRGIDAANLSSMIQAFVVANPSGTPLNPVIDALYEAIFSNSSHQDPTPYVRRYLDATDLFAHNLIHAGATGPHAGLRALEMRIRKNSIWVPSTNLCMTSTSLLSANSNSLVDEMHRIAFERQRRKSHIQWARIHAATLELSVLMTSQRTTPGGAYLASKIFSDVIARDAVWGSEEAEWVAGICILRAVIRTTAGASRQQRDDYNELLKVYENRWKEIKDDARQALATEVLLTAKEDLTRWDEILR
ncbi:hypothetical protein AX15_000420 [Amanita polypyramis BW_CC]|nr:hypothetical protein AX15_000420 [Amanita polypyramis BW_CC]